jgi:hypothetical protein
MEIGIVERGEDRRGPRPSSRGLYLAAFVAVGSLTLYNTRTLAANTPEQLRAAARADDEVTARRAVSALFRQTCLNIDEIESAMAGTGPAAEQAREAWKHFHARFKTPR